jgi:predicted dehydrogenase
MLRFAIIGLGKMGLSHYAIINAHPDVCVAAICDSSGYILDVLNKYTGVRTYSDFDLMLREVELDAIIIATPSSMHARMIKTSLEKNLHVFCEKPFCLDPQESEELASIASEKRLVNQIGYHYRFVGAFQEAKRLLNIKALGEVTHVLAEAYGPVVLRSKGSTWRTQRSEGGGCLYDYAAHPINLLNWYFGAPQSVGGCVLNKIFSRDTDDEVLGTLHFEDGKSAQLSVNWSDESCRKMTTKITIWGTNGRIYADRQECQVYLRNNVDSLAGYERGWNIRYTTDLTNPVWFYLRGEEYSAQLDYFVRCIEEKQVDGNVNSFEEAAVTDRVIAALIADAEKGPKLKFSHGLKEKEKKRLFFTGH